MCTCVHFYRCLSIRDVYVKEKQNQLYVCMIYSLKSISVYECMLTKICTCVEAYMIESQEFRTLDVYVCTCVDRCTL